MNVKQLICVELLMPLKTHFLKILFTMQDFCNIICTNLCRVMVNVIDIMAQVIQEDIGLQVSKS